MEWPIIVALAVAIPIILFPVAFVWYINIGGIYTAIKQARAKRAAIKKRVTQKEEMPVREIEYNLALTEVIKRYPWNK
jgi:hypothetical protein